MKMTEKTKKYLTVGGGTVICVVLIAAIGLQFGKAPAAGDKLPEESSSVVELTVDSGSLSTGEAEMDVEETSTEETSTEEKEPVIQPNTDGPTDSPETTQPVDTRPAQTDRTEQSIQPEVTKPAEPEESVKTNPTQKPDGTKVETPPVPVEHEAVEIPPETTAAPGQPQGGDVKDGQTYFPGFGWVDGTGDAQGSTAEDMYENGNKIGEMGE